MSEHAAVTRVVLARHGEASYPDDGVLADLGGVLTETGRAQARALGSSLQRSELAAIYTSELSRARQTGEIVGDLLQLPVEAREGLQEYEIGQEVGGSEALESALSAWLAGDLQVGILGGESGDQVGRRVFGVLDDVVRRHEGRTTLVVSHGGVIIATLGIIAPGRSGLPGPDGRLSEGDIPGGAAFLLQYDGREWTVIGRHEVLDERSNPVRSGSAQTRSGRGSVGDRVGAYVIRASRSGCCPPQQRMG